MSEPTALDRAREVFASRTSFRVYPLRDTHVNDVPVVAAELMREWARDFKAERDALKAKLGWFDAVADEMRVRDADRWEPMEEYGEIPAATPSTTTVVQQAQRIKELEARIARAKAVPMIPGGHAFNDGIDAVLAALKAEESEGE